MSPKSTPMLKHHSLVKSAKATVGTVYEAMDRRSQTRKDLLLPKRRLAWVSLLSEQLNPVRLRSGRIALIGAFDALADMSKGARPSASRRPVLVAIAIFLSLLLVLSLAGLFRQTSLQPTGAANSWLTSATQSESASINSSANPVNPRQCGFENALNNTATASKLYLLKVDLASRFHARFNLQSPIGGVAKGKAKACNVSFEVTFVRDQRGWHLNDLSKD